MSFHLDTNLAGVSQFASIGKRPAQEDVILVDSSNGIFVVADGFGGPVAGLGAAKLCCDSVRQYLAKKAGDQDATMPFVLKSYYTLAGNVLFNALIFANRSIVGQNKGKNVHLRGGASVLAAYLDGDILSLANVGICSSWMFRDGKKVRLTLPRSYSRFLNGLKENQVGSESRHDVPLTALGLSEDLEPEIFEYRLTQGDWVIIHTDGVPVTFSDAVTRTQLLDKTPQESADLLEKELNQISFVDNASALIIFK